MTVFDDELQRTWREGEPEMPPLVNMRHEQIKLVVSVLLGGLGILVSWWFVWQRPEAPETWVLAVMVTGVIVVLMGMEWWMRRLMWHALAEHSALSYIAQMAYRLQVEWRIWRLSRSGLVVVSFFVLIWTPWKLMADAEAYIRNPLRGVVGVVGILIIFVGQCVVLARKRRALFREEEALRALKQDFEEDDEHMEEA